MHKETLEKTENCQTMHAREFLKLPLLNKKDKFFQLTVEKRKLPPKQQNQRFLQKAPIKKIV